MKLLALCGSPIPHGNTMIFLEKALESLEYKNVDIEIVSLALKTIEDCTHCNACMRNEDESVFCSHHKDDAEEILHKIKKADILVAASPVYFGRMSAPLAAVFDRTRPFLYSKAHRGAMRDKVGVALAVGWGRNSGAETTLISIVSAFMTLDMIPVGHNEVGAVFGAVGISNPVITGTNPSTKDAVAYDELGSYTAQKLLRRAVNLAGRIERA